MCACIFALVIRNANRIFSAQLCVITCGLPWLCVIFPREMINGTIFVKKKLCFLYFLYLLSETFLILRRIQRDINVHRCLRSARYFCQILIKLASTRHIFEKFSDIEFNENPCGGSQVGPCLQTERHDVINSGFSRFCESV